MRFLSHMKYSWPLQLIFVTMIVRFAGTGTSQGVPVIGCTCEVCVSADPKDKRLRTSVYIEAGETKLMIDAGPDFRQQCLRIGVNRLDAILITHGHKDHVAGIDDIRALNYVNGTPVKIYCDELGERAIRQEIPYAFADMKYPGVPEAEFVRIGLQPFEIGSLHILPLQVMHYKLPVLGFRMGGFCYITDANFIAPEELDKIRGTEVLVINALRKQKHISHFSLDEAIEIGKASGARKVYITHVSHQMGLHEMVENDLPQGFHLAYDGLILNL